MGMNEVWKDIPGYEGRYQASTEGRIRSVDLILHRRLKQGKRGEMTRHGALKTLTPGNSNIPYLKVWLHGDAGRKCCLVHRVIAMTFLGPCPEGQEVRHLNNDYLDNRVENLAYGTHLENTADTIRDERHAHRLNPDEVRCIRGRIASGETNTRIAKDYGVSDVVISNIRLGRYYQWVE